MANTYKILGQAALALNTNTTVYTVGGSKEAIVSTISICNRNPVGVATAIRVAVVNNTSTLSSKHYILYDVLVDGTDSLFKTIGITLQAGDKIIVRANTVNVSVSIFGNELDPAPS